MTKKFLKFGFYLLLFVSVFLLLSRGHIYSQEELTYGITFSKMHAESLGLDWRAAYAALLSDLGVKKIRLGAYWKENEKVKEEYDFTDLDWLVAEAGKAEAKMIMAVGLRLPRWPECHAPDWTEGLPDKQREELLLKYIEQVIRHYRNDPNIVAWQVENEPFLILFGNCPKLDKSFLDRELDLVRKLDSSRPIVVTDSGELSLWVPAARRADIFGTTMYRDTFSAQLKRYVHYPITPGFFRFKKNIARIFAHPKEWIVIELQAEPWGPKPYQYLSQEERNRTMSLEKFQDMIRFSSQTGFKEFYLWGAEWWYWEKTVNNNPAFWEEARILFNKKTMK